MSTTVPFDFIQTAFFISNVIKNRKKTGFDIYIYTSSNNHGTAD